MVPVRAGALRKAAVSAGIICALALVLGLMLVRRGAERGNSTPGERREETGASAGATPVETPPAAPSLTDGETAAVPDAPPLELRGTLVLLDTDGSQHPEEDGEFGLLRHAFGEGPLRVAVTRGTWRAPWIGPAFPAELHVMGIHAGGDAEVEGRIPVSPEGEVHIRATRLPPAPVLEVIGKDTGAGLEGVTLVAGSWIVRGKTFGSSATPHDSFGPEQVLIESESSPLVLERTSANARRLQGNCTVWARAPGYAWGSTVVDLKRGGRYLLILEREAVLEVSISGNEPPGTEEDPALLRIRRLPDSKEAEDMEEIDQLLKELAAKAEAKRELDEQLSSLRDVRKQIEVGCEGAVVATVPAAIGSKRIEGLPPGKFSACVELGGPWEDRVVLGSGRADLGAGETARVEITLEKQLDTRPAVPLEGVIHLSPGWEPIEMEIDVVQLDAPKLSRPERKSITRRADGPGTYPWSAGMVPPGRYELWISPFIEVQVLEVPPEGKRDAVIRVGEPIEVRVRVVDAQTGADVEDVDVGFYNAPVEKGSGRTGGFSSPSNHSGDHVFRGASGGRYLVQAWSDAHLPAEELVHLSAAPRSIVLALRPACGVFVGVHGWSPPDQEAFELSLEPLEGEGKIVGRHTARDGTLRLTVDSPGLYELRVPRIEGLAPVAPIRIQIPPDRYVEQTITLRRE